MDKWSLMDIQAFILRGFHILAQIYSVLAPHLMSDVGIILNNLVWITTCSLLSICSSGGKSSGGGAKNISEYYDQFRKSNQWFIYGFILVKEENYN